MTTPLRGRPSYLLTRQFLAGLFDLGFLSESASGSLAKTIGGIMAVLLSLGVLLARGFIKRYEMANDPYVGGPLVYHHVALADHFFLIAAPMWIVAFVTVLVGPSLFPDETDFRVLMPMPVARRLIFGAKLGALAIFVGIFATTAEASLLPLFTVTIVSPYLDHGVPALAGAYLVASVAGAVFAALGVMSLHALLLLLVPRRLLAPASAAVSSLLILGLVVSVPFVGRFTTMGSALENGAGWLFFVPPAWFAGMEQWLLGHAESASFAQAGAGALAVALSVSAGAYLILYRHFERVMLKSGGRTPTAGSVRTAAAVARVVSDPHAVRPHASSPRGAYTAVSRFTSLTLRRSPLHQGVLVTIAAIGAALVVNGVVDIDFRTALAAPATAWRHRELVNAIVWAPFAFIFVATLAIRASLLVPIEPRANWVFRITERPAHRLPQLDAVARTMRIAGVVVPALVLLPVQWIPLGASALTTTGIAVLCGALLVEVLFLDWRRIPFTCSYIVGKGFVPLVILKGLLAYFLFTTFGSGMAYVARAAPPFVGLTLGAVLLVAILAVRRLRRASQEDVPLEFEDSLPSDVTALRLTSG